MTVLSDKAGACGAGRTPGLCATRSGRRLAPSHRDAESHHPLQSLLAFLRTA